MSYTTLDGTGAKQAFSTTTDGSGNLVGSTCVTDPTSGNKQAVGTTHSADNEALPGNSALVSSVPLLFNQTTFDREQGNVDKTASLVTISAQGAGTVTSIDQTNVNHRGLQLGINITAITGTSPTMQVTIQGKDVVSGVYYTLLQSVSLTATGFTLLTVFPGITTTANIAASQVLPRTWRVSVTVGGTSPSVTATIGASIIV